MVRDKRRILLVDDDSAVRFVLQATLKGMGGDFEVVSASGFDAALAAFRTRSFDLLVTDLMLRAGDGVDVTRETRAMSPALPVIWITGYGCERFAQEAEELDVYCCLDKPVAPSLLRRLARQALKEDGRTADETEQTSE